MQPIVVIIKNASALSASHVSFSAMHPASTDASHICNSLSHKTDIFAIYVYLRPNLLLFFEISAPMQWGSIPERSSRFPSLLFYVRRACSWLHSRTDTCCYLKAVSWRLLDYMGIQMPRSISCPMNFGRKHLFRDCEGILPPKLST